MAKQKKKPKRNIIMGRSDIPFSQRMAMKHQADIAYNLHRLYETDQRVLRRPGSGNGSHKAAPGTARN